MSILVLKPQLQEQALRNPTNERVPVFWKPAALTDSTGSGVAIQPFYHTIE